MNAAFSLGGCDFCKELLIADMRHVLQPEIVG